MILAALIFMTAALPPTLVGVAQEATHQTAPADLMERRLAALSQIETGNNDNARGADGEVSRYQILPALWKKFAPGARPANKLIAASVARKILTYRIAMFERSFHRLPTDAQAYLLWHRPSRVLRPRPAEAERAARFANLVAALP